MRTQTKPTFQPRATPRQGANLATVEHDELDALPPPTFVVAAVMRDQQRRDMNRVIAQVTFEAGRMAEGYYYSWKAGKDKDTGEDKYVEGATIGAAEMLMRCWGNCTCLPKLIDEDATHWLLEATFIDVEAGVGYPRLFRQRKSEAHQRGDEERLMDIAFQIGQSKAIRNAILAGIPEWLEDEARTAAKKAAAAKYQNVGQEWPKFLAVLAKRNVSEEMVRARLGLGPGDKPTSEHLATLAAIGRSIKDRQTTIEAEFFGNTATADTIDDAAQAVIDAAKAAEAKPAAEAPKATNDTPPVAESPKSGEKKTAPKKEE